MPGSSLSDHEVDLAHLTTLRIGGPARTFVEAKTEADFISIVADCDARGEPVLLLAGGSNLVIGDDGFDGTVVKVATSGISVREALEPGDPALVRVAAGQNWDRLVAEVVSDGYSGIETLSGIPGSVGATPVQNVGAYGHEVAEVIESVEVYDRTTGTSSVMSAADCRFGYRSSVFKSELGRWLILAVTMRLTSRSDSLPIRYADLAKQLEIAIGDTVKPIQVRRAVLNVRRQKGMVLDIDDHDTWSVGSFFTNPVVTADGLAAVPAEAPRWPMPDGTIKLSAAWLIEQAGYGKGFRVRPDSPAAVSSKHTLALTNRGQAASSDITELARVIRDGVQSRFAVTLEPEPQLVNCRL